MREGGVAFTDAIALAADAVIRTGRLSSAGADLVALCAPVATIAAKAFAGARKTVVAISAVGAIAIRTRVGTVGAVVA